MTAERKKTYAIAVLGGMVVGLAVALIATQLRSPYGKWRVIAPCAKCCIHKPLLEFQR